jgi:hypothetical protein
MINPPAQINPPKKLRPLKAQEVIDWVAPEVASGFEHGKDFRTQNARNKGNRHHSSQVEGGTCIHIFEFDFEILFLFEFEVFPAASNQGAQNSGQPKAFQRHQGGFGVVVEKFAVADVEAKFVACNSPNQGVYDHFAHADGALGLHLFLAQFVLTEAFAANEVGTQRDECGYKGQGQEKAKGLGRQHHVGAKHVIDEVAEPWKHAAK